ncbi:MAG TPA: SDR family NAD(P)-dependent oxidoreductase [Candidatus Competibacteraceae bacterium]|nr:SDR family NAD(P)-dependent oxidoreductase [Candidatus Competibacteraceae bacterium]
MTDLTQQIALITGASRGIGRAIALAFAQAGADIAVNYQTQAAAAAAVCAEIAALGRRSLAVQADVSQSGEVARLVATVERDLGPPSLLVNNAGLAQPRSLEALTEQDWDLSLAVNLTSAFLLIQAVLPGMRAQRWGRIINVSSVAAAVGGVVGPHYAAAKAGLLGLTHAYAARLATEGITVNAIAPALIATDMVADNPQARPDRIPVGRFGTVDEVAQAALLLAGNGYITGQTLHVNGGWYLT